MADRVSWSARGVGGKAMTNQLSHETARRLLRYCILDNNDVRDRLSNQSYRDLLTSAYEAAGIEPTKEASEVSAKSIMRRAALAAKGIGLYGDPRPPARAALSVLKHAASGKRARR